jgi:hypothetical protein
MVRLHAQQVGHQRDDERLRDGLAIADRQRSVGIGVAAQSVGHEFVPRYVAHDFEYLGCKKLSPNEVLARFAWAAIVVTMRARSAATSSWAAAADKRAAARSVRKTPRARRNARFALRLIGLQENPLLMSHAAPLRRNRARPGARGQRAPHAVRSGGLVRRRPRRGGDGPLNPHFVRDIGCAPTS